MPKPQNNRANTQGNNALAPLRTHYVVIRDKRFIRSLEDETLRESFAIYSAVFPNAARVEKNFLDRLNESAGCEFTQLVTQ